MAYFMLGLKNYVKTGVVAFWLQYTQFLKLSDLLHEHWVTIQK